MDIKIIQATKRDSQILADILTEATQYKAERNDMAWGVEPFLQEEVNQLMSVGRVYIAYLNHEPIGTFSLQDEDKSAWGDQQLPAVYLHRLALRNDYHGREMGLQLIRKAEAETLKLDRHLLRLDCEEKNVKLCKYYETEGFRKIGTRKLTVDSGEYIAALYEKEI